MTDDNRDSISGSPSPPSSAGDGELLHFGRLWERRSLPVPSKRVVTIGVVALLVVLAGCGGGSTNGTQTPANETDTSTPAAETEPATEAGTATETTARPPSPTGAETTVTTDSDREPTTTNGSESESEPTTMTTTNGSEILTTSTPVERAMINTSPEATGLDVVVEPRTANTSDVGVWVYAAMNEDSATEGIETVSVDAGEGLDVSNVSVFNVETAGIDETSNYSGQRTDGAGLGSNVEGGIRTNDDGEGFVVPLDGNRSVDSTDEIVVVIDGGVATTAPGNYTFSLAVNNASAQEDSYNVTEG